MKRTMSRDNFYSIAKELIIIIIGAAAYAVGFQFFLYPNNIIAGGVTGVSTIINRLTGIPVGVMSILINIPLFIYAWCKFGIRFMIMSLVGMSLTYVFVDLLALVDFIATQDMFISSMIGAAINGAGLGIVYLSGATTGGTDIIAKVLRRKNPYINFGTFIFVLNFVVIMAFALLFGDLDAAMYSVVAMFISTRAVDAVLYGINTSKVCYIISPEINLIENAITKNMKRGVTRLLGKGAYTGERREVLMTVIKKRQITDLRHIVKDIDSSAFFIVTDSKDVFGNGFGNINDD